jgi:hypothetical protein
VTNLQPVTPKHQTGAHAESTNCADPYQHWAEVTPLSPQASFEGGQIEAAVVGAEKHPSTDS